MKTKRTIAILLVVCFVVSLTATATSAMIIKTSAVDVKSSGGSNWAAGNFDIAGFKYPGTAYVCPTGWGFTFSPSQKDAKNFGIFQMRFNEYSETGYSWTTGNYDVRPDGHVRGKFIGMSNNQGDNQNPFWVRINYMVIQNA